MHLLVWIIRKLYKMHGTCITIFELRFCGNMRCFVMDGSCSPDWFLLCDGSCCQQHKTVERTSGVKYVTELCTSSSVIIVRLTLVYVDLRTAHFPAAREQNIIFLLVMTAFYSTTWTRQQCQSQPHPPPTTSGVPRIFFSGGGGFNKSS